MIVYKVIIFNASIGIEALNQTLIHYLMHDVTVTMDYGFFILLQAQYAFNQSANVE